MITIRTATMRKRMTQEQRTKLLTSAWSATPPSTPPHYIAQQLHASRPAVAATLPHGQ